MKVISTDYLKFQQGSSDKVYIAQLVQVADGFVVNFQYGRNGSTFKEGTKTQTPVERATADDIYKKLVMSKMKKGYILDCVRSKTAHAISVVAREQTGLESMQLNPVDINDCPRYIKSTVWGMQEKFDGKHLIIKRTREGLVVSNKQGLACALPAILEQQLTSIPSDFEVAGECIGETLQLYDLHENNLRNWRTESYAQRHAQLRTTLGNCRANVHVALLYKSRIEKQAIFDSLQANDAEGVVWKKLNAPWRSGKPNSGGPALKCKFWATASAIVMQRNEQRSVQVALFDGAPVGRGDDRLLNMGNVTIPPNAVVPGVGNVIEVRYLYVQGLGGKFYQPTYLRLRDDVGHPDCTIEKQGLKYKAESA